MMHDRLMAYWRKGRRAQWLLTLVYTCMDIEPERIYELEGL